MTINWNGNLTDDDKPLIKPTNRAFRYGDSVFETIRYSSGKLYFFEAHYFRLMASMRILRMEIPMSFSPEHLEAEIMETIEANHLERQPVRVRFGVYRDGEGLYTPETNNIGYVIEVQQLPALTYELNEEGLEIELFKDYYVQRGMLSNLKSANALLYVVASVFKKENGFDECILVNDDKMATEAISSNLFMVQKGEIFTPPLSSGCLKGIVRGQILKNAKRWGFTITEKDFSPFELQRADEVFLTNAIDGIKWVGKYRRKSYGNEVSKSLIQKLSLLANLG